MWLLVCLSQHSLSRLNQNVHLGVLHHFLSHVSITDTAVCSGQVLAGGIQVVDGVLQTVLESPEGCASLRYAVDRCVDYVDGCASNCLAGNVYVIQDPMLSCAYRWTQRSAG